MPLYIFPFIFDQISGPNNFAILIPNKEILDLCKVDYLPIIILLGDFHEDIDITSMCNDSEKEIATYIPLWFRSLDMLASENCPIDYFLESFFHPKLLNESLSKLEPYYLHDKHSINLINEEGFSPMNMIQQLHINCFSTTTTGQNKCITSNIRYHFTDIRLDREYQNLSNEDIERVHIMRHLLNENLPTKELFTQATTLLNEAQTNKKGYPKYFIPINKTDNQVKSSSEHEASQYHATFENVLIEALNRIINGFNINILGFLEEFYDKEILDLYIAALTNPKEFIKICCDIPEFKTQSMLGKQMINKTTNELNQSYIQLLSEYNLYCHKRILSKNKYFNSFVEICKLINENYGLFYASGRIKLKKEEGSLRTLTESKIKKIFQTCDLDKIITDITLPLMDMYFLFRSWKQIPKPCLSIYNAGSIHTSTLYGFLTKKYYNSYFGAGNRIDNNITKTHVLKHQLSTEFKSIVKGKLEEKKRCITIQKNIDLYELIIINLQSQQESLKSFLDKKTKMLNRFNVLKFDLFKQIIEGYPISEEDYKDRINKYNNSISKNDTIIDSDSLSLGLTSIRIFDEYKSKRIV